MAEVDFSKLSDKELAQIANGGGPDGGTDFNSMSDKDLMAIAYADQPKEESFGRRITRSAVNTVLPVAGAVGAGLLATPETMGMGTIPAAAMGYAGGKQLARIANHYLLGDDPGATKIPEQAKQTLGDLGEGAMFEMGGQIVGKAASGAKNAILDVATAPFKTGVGEGAGSAAKALDAVGRGGKYVNDKLDDAVSVLLPQSGDKTADAVMKNITKRAGYFTPLAKVNAAADVAQAAPFIAQKGATGLAQAIEFMSPAAEYSPAAARAIQGMLAGRDSQNSGPMSRRMEQLTKR